MSEPTQDDVDPLDGARTAACRSLDEAGAVVAVAITVDKNGQIRMNSLCPKKRPDWVRIAIDGILQGMAIEETKAALDDTAPQLAAAIRNALH